MYNLNLINEMFTLFGKEIWKMMMLSLDVQFGNEWLESLL